MPRLPADPTAPAADYPLHPDAMKLLAAREVLIVAELESATRWIYIRHTNPAGERAITSHIVWDAKLFFDALTRQVEKMNRERAEGKLAGTYSFAVITREAYLESLARKKA